MKIPLLSGSYEGISSNISTQELINFYFEKAPEREMHDGALLPVHGAELFVTLPNAGDIRGLLYYPGSNRLYVVSDNDFYDVQSNGTVTDRGDLNTSSGLVQMAVNPSTDEIIIVDGTNGYLFDAGSGTFSTISDADFPDTATTCAHIDGFFLVNDPSGNGKFVWSDLNDGSSWDSLNTATAQSLTSTVKKIHVHNRLIFLFGDTNSEVWFDSGSDTQFDRLEKINVGIVSKDAACQFDTSVAILSRSDKGELNAALISEGYQPKVISTPALSRKWHQLSDVSDAFMYSYQVDGHEFLVVTFPTGNATYAYDAVTQQWHQRSGAFSSNNPTRDKVNAIAFCTGWGGHIVGDFNSTGKLWSLEEDTYTFDSSNMERRVTGPLIALENESQLRFSEVQIDIEEGVNSGSETGNDGELTLTYSKDGGHTYSSGVQLSLGTSRTARLMKRKLGTGRLWNFRLYTDTPNKIIVKGAYGRIAGEPKQGYGSSKK